MYYKVTAQLSGIDYPETGFLLPRNLRHVMRSCWNKNLPKWTLSKNRPNFLKVDFHYYGKTHLTEETVQQDFFFHCFLCLNRSYPLVYALWKWGQTIAIRISGDYWEMVVLRWKECAFSHILSLWKVARVDCLISLGRKTGNSHVAAHYEEKQSVLEKRDQHRRLQVNPGGQVPSQQVANAL